MFDRREYDRLYKRDYRETHREIVNEQARRSYNNNRQKILERKREYYLNNSDKIKTKLREHYQNNKDEKKEYNRIYYQNNRNQILENVADWQKKNPEKKNHINRKRYLREIGAVGSHTLAEWEEIEKMGDYQCLACGRCEPEILLTEDHIIPLSRGGSNFIDNIQPLCTSCNSAKHTKIIDYRLS